MIFLGSLFNTINMTISVPQDKLKEIIDLVTVWLSKHYATKRQLQSLIGKLQFAAHCVRPGRIFIARLLRSLRNSKSGCPFKIYKEFRRDLQWWHKFFPLYNGVSLTPRLEWSPPDSIVETDACLSGCGGISGTEFFYSRVSRVH
jgi:hypothetical protein